MIIALSGKIGAGKDLVGSIIQYLTVSNIKGNTFPVTIEEYLKGITGKLYDNGYGDNIIDVYETFKIEKFANTLKDIVCLLTNCTREQLEDREFKEQELGEEWRIWFMTHYKLNGNKIGKLYSSKQEITEYENSEFFKSFKLDGYQIETKILTRRLLLQLLGTDCGRDIIHPNIWINSLFSKYIPSMKTFTEEAEVYKGNAIWNTGYNPKVPVEHHNLDIGNKLFTWYRHEYPNWIITDLRFPNELKAIEERKGITIRINRNYVDNENKILKVDFEEHESETALDNATFSYIIDNNGTIEELIEKVKEILIKENLI